MTPGTLPIATICHSFALPADGDALYKAVMNALR